MNYILRLGSSKRHELENIDLQKNTSVNSPTSIVVFRTNKVYAMAEKTPVLTDKAPKPLAGIYSQAIKANGFVFVSGAVPMDAATGKIVDGDIQAHTVS